MRKLIYVYVSCFIAILQPAYAKEVEKAKFKTTITIVYNALTLEEAAKKEQAFRETYKDACSVSIGVEEISKGSDYLVVTGDVGGRAYTQ